jgi:Group II intron, maturase-specific domain/Reverse transcriptase (RNA-dependent DNA polymerase)
MRPREELLQRLRDDGGERAPRASGVGADPCDERHRQLDGKYACRVRHRNMPIDTRALHVAMRLPRRAAEPLGKLPRGIRRRHARVQQVRRGVDPLGEHVTTSATSRTIVNHVTNVLPTMSRHLADAPRPLNTPVAQRHLKTEVAHCVGGVVSPLLANIALSVLDEHFAAKWEALGPEWTRAKHRRAGGAVMKLVRYADDFVVMLHGTRADADALWDEVGAVLAPMGLRLSVEKTRVCHIDEGFDFLGWHIQRRAWRSRSGKTAIYTYPSKKTLASIIDKVRALTRRAKHRTLADLLRRLNPVLRGWCNYFRQGVSARTFGYLDHYAFWRIVGWLRKRHLRLNMHTLIRRFLPGWKIRAEHVEMFRPKEVAIVRYRYRGTRIPTPWSSPTTTAV